MIDVTILSKYLPYGLKFQSIDSGEIYTLYSLSIEGDVLLKDEDGDNVVVNNSHIGKRYKPILKPCTNVDRIFFSNDEGYQKHLDTFDLISENLAVKIKNPTKTKWQ